MLQGGNSGLAPPQGPIQPDVPQGTPTTLSPIADQRSPPRKLSWQNDGGSGLNPSDPHLLDGMAEVTVEKTQQVTRTGYRPEAATLRTQIGQLEQALLRTQQWSQEEITQQRVEFETCAHDFEIRARDVRGVEVAQSVAAKYSVIIAMRGQHCSNEK